MSVASKVKALISLKDKDYADVAAALGISKQALSNKISRDSFFAADLVKIADAVGCKLMFVADDAQIALTVEDVRDEAEEKA